MHSQLKRNNVGHTERMDAEMLCDIARSAFEVANRLLSCGQRYAQALRSSETGSRQIYREESLTVEMATVLHACEG